MRQDYSRTDIVDAVRDLDYFILLTPLEADSHHIVTAGVLAAMKPGAFLLNLARGGVLTKTHCCARWRARRSPAPRLMCSLRSHCPIVVRCGPDRMCSSRLTWAAFMTTMPEMPSSSSRRT